MSIKLSKKRNLPYCVFLFFSAFFFSACGLDTFYNLEPPVVTHHAPIYNNEDASQKYFEFSTNDATNNTLNGSGFKYLGTVVFYRIYANAQTMESHSNSIQSVNNSTNYNAAADRIRSYGYQQLYTTLGETDFVIQPGAGSRRVKIRLTDNNEYNSPDPDPLFLPYIEIDGVSSGKPKRATDGAKGKYTFDFGREADELETCKKPVSGDSDFESGSFSSGYSDTYFVNLYAVAVGQDTTFTEYYSNVLHLGAVSIDSTSKRN